VGIPGLIGATEPLGGVELPGLIGTTELPGDTGTGLPGTIVRCSGLVVITGRERVTGATEPPGATEPSGSTVLPGGTGGTVLPGTIVRCSGVAAITGRDRVPGATVPIMVLPLVSWLILSPGSSGIHQTEDSRLGGHANIEGWLVGREPGDRAGM
jgi:hypothetical protein